MNRKAEFGMRNQIPRMKTHFREDKWKEDKDKDRDRRNDVSEVHEPPASPKDSNNFEK